MTGKYTKMWQVFLFLRSKLSSVEVFFIGAVAKAVATTVTYPLQTVQSILRVGFMQGSLFKVTRGWLLFDINWKVDVIFLFVLNLLQFGQFNETKDRSKLLSSLRTIKCLLVNRMR